MDLSVQLPYSNPTYDPLELEARARTIHEVSATAGRILLENSDWESTYSAARSLMSMDVNGHEHLRDAIVATLILRNSLLAESSSTSRNDAAAHLVEILVRVRSPEASLISDALAQLDGHVEPARLSQLAGSASEAAQEYLARRSDCETCTYAQLGAHIEGQAMARLGHTLEGVTRLENLAGR